MKPHLPRRTCRRRQLSSKRAAAISVSVLLPAVAAATPSIQQLTDTHGQYYLVNNGALTAFQIYKTGALAGKITSIVYDGQEMTGAKDFYYDIQGSPNIYL